MTAKEYLSGVASLQVRIRQLQEQRQMYLDMALSVTAPISPIKVQTSPAVDRMGDAVAKVADMDAVIEVQIEKLLLKQHEIITEIQSLHDAKYMQLLFKIYVQGKNIKTAADEMKMSYQYVRGLHKKALAAFEESFADMLADTKA